MCEERTKFTDFDEKVIYHHLYYEHTFLNAAKLPKTFKQSTFDAIGLLIIYIEFRTTFK